jgi:hypothetical protein
VSDLSDAIGLVILFVSLGIGGLTLYLLRGKARLGPILSAFAQVTLLPERRRWFLFLLWVESLCFLASGILLGLVHLGIQVTSDPDLLYTACFLAGMISLGVLVWFGLSPRPLTEEEMATATQGASTIMKSIWMMPYQEDEKPKAKRRAP